MVTAIPAFVAFALIACEVPDSLAGDTGETASADDTAQPLDLVLGVPQVCEAPVASVSYADAAEAWGLHGMTVPLTNGKSDGGGVVVDDLDGDGDLDIVLSYQGESQLWVFRRNGDHFEATAVPAVDPYLPSLGDVNGDGRRDLLLGSSKPAYYLNLGDTFAAPVTLLDMGFGEVRELAAGDLDGDGDVDLFATASSRSEDNPADSQDHVLWNEGGAFRDEALPLPQAAAKSYDSILVDADQDGDPDVYQANDAFDDWPGNSYYRNDGGTLVDAGAECFCAARFPAMGVTAGDYDADGWPDLYVAGEGRNYLLSGGPGAVFVDTTQAMDADPTRSNFQMAWGAAFLDYDNDGSMDIAVGSGDFATWEAKGTGDVPLNLLRREGDAFTDVTAAVGLPDGVWRALVPADFNHDGVLDLLATRLEATPGLFLSNGCTEAGWISVTAPEGATVEVQSDGRTQTGFVTTDSGYGAAHPPSVWFGLGSAQSVDRLSVRLPWGGPSAEWHDVAARREVHVR